MFSRSGSRAQWPRDGSSSSTASTGAGLCIKSLLERPPGWTRHSFPSQCQMVCAQEGDVSVDMVLDMHFGDIEGREDQFKTALVQDLVLAVGATPDKVLAP